MRTKTLLIAAAALVAGVISSNAQVFSANVVGYANVATPVASENYLITVPFTMGVSNGANEVFGTTLPDFSTILLWDIPSQNYITVQAFSGSPTGWADSGFSPVPPPILPVGQGFFLNPSGPLTNVFSGAVAVNVGTSNQMTFANPSVNYLVAPVVPYSGSVTNGNSSGGGANLNGLPDFSTVLVWDVPSQNYITVQAFSGSPTGWADSGFSPVAPPTISVGQGFFINPSDVYVWTVGL
jgi:hypothetical protein